jgi:hypothetical protein
MDNTDLLSQIPPGIIVYAVLTFGLIFGLMVYFAAVRPGMMKRRREAKKLAALTAPKPAPLTTPRASGVPTVMPVSGAGGDDLPDLDFLLNADVPAPRPAGPRQLGEAEVRLVTGETVRAREELVLLRDSNDGRLIVQMSVATYKSFASAPSAKAAFTQLMNELAKSLTQPDPGGASAVQAPPAAAAPPPVVPNIPTIVPPPVPTSRGATLPGDLPKYSEMRGSELKGRGFLGRPKFEFEDIPDLNIAGSIEAYLQHRLIQTPGYAGRSWHVHPDLKGGVRIEVDGQFFEAVSDITDPAARAFIQTAIQEWQDRQ